MDNQTAIDSGCTLFCGCLQLIPLNNLCKLITKTKFEVAELYLTLLNTVRISS